MNGVLLVDKPSGVTSHDVVDHVRRAAGIRRVGHTGTLDPAATGLLILCAGPATRLSEFLTSLDKVYEGDMRLGVTTDSHDLDGGVLAERDVPELCREDLQEVFDRFRGETMQVPPMVSAVKVNGERLYKRARKGEVVPRAARLVTIHEFSVLGYTPPEAHFVLRCTSGTYARSLCHEIGEAIGCGAALASLRRTSVGHHSVSQAWPMEDFSTRDDVAARLLPVEQALDLPSVTVRSSARRVVECGGAIDRTQLLADCSVEDGWVQMKSEDGELLALGEAQSRHRIQPKRVLCARS